jgi:tRNA(fMet)-specific endonuclease VapC
VKYLLDTTVISDFVRGQWAVRERLLRTSPSELAVSALTVMEVEYGLARDPARAQRIRPGRDALLAQLRCCLALSWRRVRQGGSGPSSHGRARPIGPFDR